MSQSNSPLWRAMQRQMELRRLSPRTIDAYLAWVRR